jgi:hypothetical protein
VGLGHQFGRLDTVAFERERASQQRSGLWFRQMLLCGGGCFFGFFWRHRPALARVLEESEVPTTILLIERSMAHARWVALSGVQ